MVLEGTLTMYLGEPPQRVDVLRGGLIHVEATTPLQTVNHGAQDLLLYVYGYPPEDEHAEILDPVGEREADQQPADGQGMVHRSTEEFVSHLESSLADDAA